MKNLFLAVLIAMLCPFGSMAQFTLSGKVSEQGTDRLLPGATLRLKPGTTVITTDASGNFQFPALKSGTYILQATYVGFYPQEKEIRIDSDQRINLSLAPYTFLADEIVVNAVRASNISPTTHKNLDKATIEKNNFGQDLPFILDNTPGVIITSDAGAGVGYTGIRVRGSDATRVNITINGIPYNDSESQGTFWVNMPDFASSVDNIQIQRGVGTSTNGAGAFGASINIQTTGNTEAYAELNNTFGSFNTWKNTVKVGSGLINDKWSFDGRLSRIKSEGFIDRAASDLKSYFLSGAFHGKKDLLRVNIFSGNEKTYQAWNGIPESRLRGDVSAMNDYIARNELSVEEANHLLSSGSRTYNSFTYQDQTDNYWQTHYQAHYARQLNERLSFNGALHYTDGRGYFEEFKANDRLSRYGLPNVEVGGSLRSRTDLVRRRWLDNDFYGFTYHFEYTPGPQWRLALGGAYNEYKGLHFGEVIWARYAPSSNIYDHYFDGKGNKNDFNSFGKVNFQPSDKLNLFLDLQYRRVHYTISGLNKNREALSFDNQYHFFNPKLGATWLLNSQSNVYASFSIANKEPNRDDFTNLKADLPDPKSERLHNVEAGYRFRNAQFQLGANVYGMFYKDQLIFTGEINEYSDAYRQNVDQSSRLGIELDASYAIHSKLAINANAALSRNKIRNYTDYTMDYATEQNIETLYQSTDISFSPRSILAAELVYKPVKSLAFALQTKYVSRQFMDNTQNESRQLDAYWVNHLRMGYDLKLAAVKNVNLGLLINNLFNKKYESNGYTYSYGYEGSITTENFYFPQAGTNFMLSLNMKF